jgi:hypothetical protein
VDRRLRHRLPALSWNPLRREQDAFQLVLVAIGVGALVVLGSWISTWVGIGVVVGLLAAGCWLLLRRRRTTRVAAVRRILLVGAVSGDVVASLAAHAETRLVSDAAAVEEALHVFPADEIVVADASLADELRARFVVPVRVLGAGGYLPETASR